MKTFGRRSGLAMIAALVLTSAAPAADEALDASIRQLTMAVTPQQNGQHLTLLFALRQLHEPSLQPLFYELVQRNEWPMQVHAVLALAELSEKHQIDPWLVRQMNPAGHEAVIASGLDLELIGVDQMNELISHEELGSMSRLLVLAELVSLNRPIPKAQLEKLCDHAEARISALAAGLLVQTGDESRINTLRSRINGVSQSERDRQLRWFFEAVRQYELAKLQSWVRSALDGETIDEASMFAGVFALAKLGDPNVMAMWTRGLGDNPSQAQQIRYALLLFACAREVPRDAFDRLPANDALLSQLATAGRAIQRGSGAADALIALFDLDHKTSADLAREHLKKLPNDESQRVYAHLVDRIGTEPDKATDDRIELGVQAVNEWFKISPDAVLARLAQAEDDSVLQQTIMLGLFDSESPKVGEAAQQIRRIGAGRADSLALLLIAKHSSTLDAEQIRQLGMIASGGGRVSSVLQTQAAWLYLQHTGNIEKALARLFPPR